MGSGRFRKTRTESKWLTDKHIDGIRFEPCQELALEVDAFKVHIDSSENIKPIRGHDLLGDGWQMALLYWWRIRGVQGKALEAGTRQLGAWVKDVGRTRRKPQKSSGAKPEGRLGSMSEGVREGGPAFPQDLAYLAIQQVCVFLAENFLVILEDAVAGPGTHEVEVAEAGGKAAAHRGSRLQAELTALRVEEAAKGRSQ